MKNFLFITTLFAISFSSCEKEEIFTNDVAPTVQAAGAAPLKCGYIGRFGQKTVCRLLCIREDDFCRYVDLGWINIYFGPNWVSSNPEYIIQIDPTQIQVCTPCASNRYLINIYFGTRVCY